MSLCQGCGRPLARESATDATKTLLRVSNIAEAGYLADRLTDAGFQARVAPTESFDAITGVWSMGYLVLVDPVHAAEAAEHLHTVLGDTTAPAGESPAASSATGDPVGMNPWTALVVLAVAVLSGLLVARPFDGGLADPNAAADQPKDLPFAALHRRLTQLGSPLTAVTADGSTQRLRYDVLTTGWTLETDADGDGRFEQQQRFAAPGKR